MARPVTEARQPSSRRRLPWILGWAAAVGLVVGLAIATNLLGPPPGPADGGSLASADAEPSPLAIAFGTAIDAVSGEVAPAGRMDRFRADDTFAYSVRLTTAASGGSIRVEVQRADGDGSGEVVQEPSEQGIPDPAEVIAFTVPAARLIEAWGPGSYVMRIYLDPAAEPIAEGGFQLLAE